MLTCDPVAQHSISGSKGFSSHYRDVYNNSFSQYPSMFTEGDIKKPSSPTPSSPSPTLVTEVPSQPQPEAVPPASAAQAPQDASMSPMMLQQSPQISNQDSRPELDMRSRHAHMSPDRISPTTVQNAIRQQQRHLYTEMQQQHQLMSRGQEYQSRDDQEDDRENYTDSHDVTSYTNSNDVINYSDTKDVNSDSDSSASVEGSEYSRREYREEMPDDQKDQHYWERRRRNNEAARKSRDKRRTQNTALEGRISSLEDDNSKLRRELLALKKKFSLTDENQVKDVELNEKPKQFVSSLETPAMTLKNGNGTHKSSVPSAELSCKLPVSSMYNTPPPLLAVSGGMAMGMPLYPESSSTLSYLSPKSPRLNEEKMKSTLQPSFPHHRPPYLSNLSPYQLPHHQNHPFHPHHNKQPPHPLDIKNEPMEEGEVRSRDRNPDIRSASQSERPERQDMQLLRRESIGTFPPYQLPSLLTQPSPANHQINHHHHHHHHVPSPHAYPSPQVPPSVTTNPHFMSRGYDGYSSQACSQRSPGSSHSSDENYDEPLQLTVRRDSGISSNHANDDSSHDSDTGAAGDKPHSSSPPLASYPLKMRHKLPAHDMPYSKDTFPNIAAVAAVTAAQSTFPPHPFMNGLAHLSDLAMGQANPMTLLKSEELPTQSSYHRQRKDQAFRRTPRQPLGQHKFMDPKYLERRRRNNEAARKCRENRKALTKLREAKSDYLESENGKLRDELNSLQEEMKQLRDLIEKKRLEQGIKDEPNTEC